MQQCMQAGDHGQHRRGHDDDGQRNAQTQRCTQCVKRFFATSLRVIYGRPAALGIDCLRRVACTGDGLLNATIGNGIVDMNGGTIHD